MKSCSACWVGEPDAALPSGTAGLPLQLQVALPKGAKLDSIRIDGKPEKGQRIATNLQTDRVIEVAFTAS